MFRDRNVNHVVAHASFGVYFGLAGSVVDKDLRTRLMNLDRRGEIKDRLEAFGKRQWPLWSCLILDLSSFRLRGEGAAA